MPRAWAGERLISHRRQGGWEKGLEARKKSAVTLGLIVLAAKHGVVTTDEALKLIKKYIWVTDDVEKEAIEKLRRRDP
ncbi:MAG: hypothetical protein QXR18_06050 [Pyrobaculum sp.]